jgi:hypothetical protein
MSGIYPDVPGPRMAYHRDGSAGFFLSEGNVISVLTAGNLQTINDESDSSYQLWPAVSGAGGTATRYVGMIFPELRDIVGYFYAGTAPSVWGGSSPVVQTSPDSTTGLDGTWTTAVATTVAGTTVPDYRTGIVPLSLTGKKAIRVGRGWSASGPVNIYSFHVYGKPVSGAVRYLMFTDTGGTEVLGPHFDFGDDPRGGAVEVKTFKVKNGHGSLTANTVTVSTSTLTDKSPSFADDYTLSLDGVTYTASIAVGTLAPGASSGTLYVKRTTPIGATLGIEAPLFSAVAASWT